MHVILNLCVCTNRISQVSWQVLWFQLSYRFLHWRGCWSSCFSTLFKTFQRHSPSTFHLKSPLWIFKETDISLLLFLPQNQHFYPVTLFIALIFLRYIILKLIPTYIYLIKSHSLDLAVKKFHKHSRSSFREIVLFAWKFEENL